MITRELFKKIRHKLGYSQEAFSIEIGVNVQSVSDIETGRKKISVDI